MAKRKVFHSKNKLFYGEAKFISPNKIIEKEIIEFKYGGEKVYDLKPLVFVLERKGSLVKGINLNYLTEYRVQQLLQEINFKSMKWYELYDEAIRSYKTNKMKLIKRVEYKRDVDAT